MFILRLIRKIEIIISDRNHYDDILRRGGGGEGTIGDTLKRIPFSVANLI